MAYATVADARAEGVPISIADDRIQAALDLYAQFIDRACRQWFEERADLTVEMDGNDGIMLFLPVPIVSLDALYINGDFDNPVDADRYTVYNGRSPLKDDRKNPKVQLVTAQTSIYNMPRWSINGPAFAQNLRQRLVGTFGYTEEDGSTPLLIKRANLKLAIMNIQKGPGGLWDEVGAGVGPSGNIMSETTDGHTLTYDAFRVNPSKPGVHGITGDQEIDRILDMYKGPPVVLATGSFSFFKG